MDLRVAFSLWSLLALSCLPSCILLCTPPSGSTLVFDQCATALLTAINGSVFKPTGYSVVTDGALYTSVGNISLANLMSARLPVATVVGPAIPYGGGGPATQQVTIVDALTADAKLGASGSILTLDITQLLAQAMFGKAVDGIYPNLQDPFLARNVELDEVVGLLTETNYNVGQLVMAMSTALTRLLSIDNKLSDTNGYLADIRGYLHTQVPTTFSTFSATPSNYVDVSLSDLLFDALYIASANNVNGAGTGVFAEYIPLIRTQAVAYYDPYQSSGANGCAFAANQIQADFPNSNFYGPPSMSSINNGFATNLKTSPITGIPIEILARCIAGKNFNSLMDEQRLADLAPVVGATALKSYIRT